MRAALIGDVHGNLPALEAVLADAERRSVDAIWHVGDFVGYGAFPDEVVERLRRSDAVSIAGNYDLKALKFKKRRAKWRKSKRREKWIAFKYAYESLSGESREYLRSLPRDVRLTVAGRRILLTHGSPAANTEHVTPETPDERLRELARLAEADVVVCGHSHRPFARDVDGVWFINTGSVGRPEDGDPRACYAVLEIDAKDTDVAHHRVAYDVDRAASVIRARGLPAVFAQMTVQGRSLDAAEERSDG